MLENLIMQATAPATVGGIDTVISIIVASSALVGTLGGLVTGIIAYLRSQSNSKDVQASYDKIIGVSKLATTFAQKTTEQEDKFKTIAEVITGLSPDAKKLLESKQMELQKLSKDLQVAKAQLDRLKPLIPVEGQADNMADLPR
jgi:hypothetical protein